MKSMLALGVSVFLALSSGEASADTRSIGFEVSSCTGWTATANDETTRNLYLTWFRGFVSGSDFSSNPQRTSVRMLPMPTVVESVDRFCRENPGQNLLHAALNLVSQLPRN
jgi:hypothetical protein